MTQINTTKVANRRKLHFDSLDQALAEARVVADSSREGTIRQLGNWTPTQCLDHLATWVDYAFNGIPIKPPLFLRLIGPMIKPFVLRYPMPAGRRLPKVPGGTFAFEPGEVEPALAHLEKSYDRIKREMPPKPNPIFGKLSHEQWLALHCRHAELHLSFYNL